MVDASPIDKKPVVSDILTTTYARRYQVFEATASTDETIPLDIGTLVAVACFRLDTGASITATVATTIVTITQAALVDVKIVGIATGAVPA